jgi:hypothetical protein
VESIEGGVTIRGGEQAGDRPVTRAVRSRHRETSAAPARRAP